MRDEEGEGVGGESKSMFDFDLSLSEIRRKMQMTADGKEGKRERGSFKNRVEANIFCTEGLHDMWVR